MNKHLLIISSQQLSVMFKGRALLTHFVEIS